MSDPLLKGLKGLKAIEAVKGENKIKHKCLNCEIYLSKIHYKITN
jgi:hypothetical protein